METDTDINTNEKKDMIETDTFHPFRRFAAQWIDGLILFLVICLTIALPLVLAHPNITAKELLANPSITILVSIINLLVVALYEGVLLGCYGTTFGKLIMGIRMVDKDSGLPIGFINGFKRYFFYLVFCFWGINFLAIFLPKYSLIISAIMIIPIIAAWRYYKEHNITKWDNVFNIKVFYGPIHKFWLTLMILLPFLPAIFLLVYLFSTIMASSIYR